MSNVSVAGNCSSAVLNITLRHQQFQFINRSLICSTTIESENVSSVFRYNCSCVFNESTDGGVTETNETQTFTYEVQIALCVIYSLIFLLGSTGNLSVIWILGYLKKRRTSGDIFTISLAVTDFIQSVAGPLVMASDIISQYADWYYGEWGCYILPPIPIVCSLASAFHLVAIAVDRYRIVVHPFKEHLRNWAAFTVALDLWLLAYSAAAPYTFAHIYLPGEKSLCWSDSTVIQAAPNEDNRMALFFCFSCLFSFLPLIFLSGIYVSITSHLRKSIVQTDCNSAMQRRRKENQKVVNMFLVVVAIFMVLTVPYSVFVMISSYLFMYNPEWFSHNANLMNKLNYSLYTINSTNSAVNPIIYSQMHKDIKSAIKTKFKKVRRTSFSSFTTGSLLSTWSIASNRTAYSISHDESYWTSSTTINEDKHCKPIKFTPKSNIE